MYNPTSLNSVSVVLKIINFSVDSEINSKVYIHIRIELKLSVIWRNRGRKARGWEVGRKEDNIAATSDGVYTYPGSSKTVA